MVDDKIVELFLNDGFIITPDTLCYLESINSINRNNLIKSAIYRAKSLANKPLIITKEFLINLDQNHSTDTIKSSSDTKPTPSPKIDSPPSHKPKSGKKTYDKIAKDIDPIIEIDSDPTGSLAGSGKIEDLHQYFLDRFKSIQSLLLKRPDSKDAIPINKLSNKNENVKIIGIVKSKEEIENKQKHGIFNYFIDLEDLTGSIKAFIPGSTDHLSSISTHILLDQVICVEGTLKNDLFIINNIFFPDIPNKQHSKQIDYQIYAALLSDLHFGSKKFMASSFMKFIDWLNGNVGSERQKQLAHKVKYVLIAGDLIDGVGVYPEHEKNLSIIDVREQYETSAHYLSQIPDHISIIIIPGGAHDAVCKALPQEAIPRSYAKPLYALHNTVLLGNPSFFKIHNMKTLIYHGEGLDDVIPSIPGISYKNNDLAMIELLKSRHLAPIYGNKAWISPEPFDWLVIRDVPDLFHCGHTHINTCSKYKGVNIVNSGTFQAETEYQQSLGIIPTPGIVPLVDLSDFSIKLKQF